MALIRCSECGHKVSDSATVCPQCGKPIDLAECKIGEINNKAKKKGIVNKIAIVLVVGIIVFGFIVPRVFFHGLLNWSNHFTVDFKEGFAQKEWSITDLNGRWLDGVTIHFVHHSKTYGNIKFVVHLDHFYGNATVFERNIRQLFDEAVKQDGASENEELNGRYTAIEYITWEKVVKNK